MSQGLKNEQDKSLYEADSCAGSVPRSPKGLTAKLRAKPDARQLRQFQ